MFKKQRNKCVRNKCAQNKCVRNKCVFLRKKCIKNYFSKVTKSDVNTNKELGKKLNLFLTNKGFLSLNEITLIEDDEVITGKNTMKNRTITTQILLNDSEPVIDAITCHFRNHPSVTEIKSNFLFAQSNAES